MSTEYTPPRNRRKEDRLLKEFRQWRRSAVVGFLIFLAVVVAGFIRQGDFIEAIQTNRENFIRDECEDVNTRHDNTIAALKQLGAEVVRRHPEQAGQVQRQIEQNTLLIDALVPVRDCDRIVRLAQPK